MTYSQGQTGLSYHGAGGDTWKQSSNPVPKAVLRGPAVWLLLFLMPPLLAALCSFLPCSGFLWNSLVSDSLEYTFYTIKTAFICLYQPCCLDLWLILAEGKMVTRNKKISEHIWISERLTGCWWCRPLILILAAGGWGRKVTSQSQPGLPGKSKAILSNFMKALSLDKKYKED